MKITKGLPPPLANKSLWDFRQIRSGDSIHVLTKSERANCVVSFRYWVEHAVSNPDRAWMQKHGAYATSRKVGPEDPDGPGYRIWFLSRVKPEDKDPAGGAEKTGDDI